MESAGPSFSVLSSTSVSRHQLRIQRTGRLWLQRPPLPLFHVCEMDSPHLKKYGFQNPKNFWSWNPQSGKIWIMESGILGFGIRNTARGIQNPANDWNAEYRIQVPLTKIWNPGTDIGNPGRGIRNPDSLTWEQSIEVNLKYVEFQNYAILKMKVRWLVSSFCFFCRCHHHHQRQQQQQ